MPEEEGSAKREQHLQRLRGEASVAHEKQNVSRAGAGVGMMLEEYGGPSDSTSGGPIQQLGLYLKSGRKSSK